MEALVSMRQREHFPELISRSFCQVLTNLGQKRYLLAKCSSRRCWAKRMCGFPVRRLRKYFKINYRVCYVGYISLDQDSVAHTKAKREKRWRSRWRGKGGDGQGEGQRHTDGGAEGWSRGRARTAIQSRCLWLEPHCTDPVGPGLLTVMVSMYYIIIYYA